MYVLNICMYVDIIIFICHIPDGFDPGFGTSISKLNFFLHFVCLRSNATHLAVSSAFQTLLQHFCYLNVHT